ncbi:MAG: sulfatase-like hydrolase/transferase [Phycisphaerales bacterium]|nr:MAG: sulfatase-like hydrolase/transferase [Phycisphaerales bacterium]
MKRRDFLKRMGSTTAAMAFAGCAGVAGERRRSPAKRWNILWLISEDTSPDLGCYGNPIVKTPNFDKLAADGALFTNAFCTAPVCSAVRSGFMTGMYQTSIGAHQHRSHRKDGYTLPEPVRVITHYFREAGYFTCNCAGLNYKRRGKTDWNFAPKEKAFDGTDWSQRGEGQPFFAQMNFSLTHRDFKRDKENPINPDKVTVPPYYPDHPVSRRDWADYLESLQVLDRQIGTVLKRLEDEGLADNTIVMYFGDHGRPHVRGKQWLYEGGIHIPMIVRWPGHIKPGTVVDDLVSSVDFAPTFLSLASIEPPKHLQGQIFLGPRRKKREYIVAARDRCDGTVDRIRCVRTKRYKYIRNFMPERPYTQFNGYKKHQYPMLTLMEVLHKQGKLTADQARFMAAGRPEEELYDLSKDAHELHNLAADPKHKVLLTKSRMRLNEWIKKTGDHGETPEDPKSVAYWQDNMEKSFEQRMAKRNLPADISPEDYLKWWERKLLD